MEQYPSATPREAAEYLTRYKLNVEVAVSVLQTDKLRPVVAFIWDDVEKGEPGEIRRKEEARLRDLIKEHREKNVQVCLSYIHTYSIHITYVHRFLYTYMNRIYIRTYIYTCVCTYVLRWIKNRPYIHIYLLIEVYMPPYTYVYLVQ